MSQIKVSNKGWLDAKWFLSSWTLWLNTVAVLIPVLDILLKANFIQDKDVYALLLALFNILLRFKTKQPVSLSR